MQCSTRCVLGKGAHLCTCPQLCSIAAGPGTGGLHIGSLLLHRCCSALMEAARGLTVARLRRGPRDRMIKIQGDLSSTQAGNSRSVQERTMQDLRERMRQVQQQG